MEAQTIKRQRGKTINLRLNRRQFIDMLRFMDKKDREYIYNELKKNLFETTVEKEKQYTAKDFLNDWTGVLKNNCMPPSSPNT